MFGGEWIAPEATQKRTRTAVKAALYRVFMVAITVGFAFLVTGRLDQAMTIGLWTNVMKTATYYGYERVWNHVTWGLQHDGGG